MSEEERLARDFVIDENVTVFTALYTSGNLKLLFLDKKSDEQVERPITFDEMKTFVARWFMTLSESQRIRVLNKMFEDAFFWDASQKKNAEI